MDELETSYDALKKQKDDLIAAHGDTAQIQSLNDQMATLLQSMLEKLSAVKSSSASITEYRDELLIQLVGIQNDANILREQRDQYATLRMLQTQDQAAFKSSFFWYALALGFAALAFLIMLLWTGRHKEPTMPATMSKPNTMADFT